MSQYRYVNNVNSNVNDLLSVINAECHITLYLHDNKHKYEPCHFFTFVVCIKQ